MYMFRMPTFTEIPVLMDLDMRCFYEPWHRDIWEFCLQNYFMRVAIDRGLIVGFVIATIDTDHPTQCRVMKVAVRQKYRMQGLSIDLLRRVVDYARSKDCTALDTWVPESYVYPSPWSVEKWLNKLHCKPVEMRHDMYDVQGYQESGIRWEIEI